LVEQTKDGPEVKLELEQTKDCPEVKLELEEQKDATSFNPYVRKYTAQGHGDEVEEYLKSFMHDSKGVDEMKFQSNNFANSEYLLDSASSDDENDFKISRDEKGHPVNYETHKCMNPPDVSHLNPHVLNPHVSGVNHSNVSQGYNPIMSSIGEHKNESFNYENQPYNNKQIGVY